MHQDGSVPMPFAGGNVAGRTESPAPPLNVRSTPGDRTPLSGAELARAAIDSAIDHTSFALIHDISLRNCLPMISTGCERSLRRIALKAGEVNVPVESSPR